MKAFLREIVVTLILAVVIFFLLQSTVQTFEIRLSSMEPSFHEGQRILVSKIAYRFHEPERGDVIVFHAPTNPQADYIKRIIALPGESVEIKQGTVYIYKEDDSVLLLDEPYVAEKASHPFKGSTIPENEYFVLGDNRNNSSDSRTGWTVKREGIIGKAWLSIWPPDRRGLVANPLQEQLAAP